jgi:hypothetical protein
MTTILKIIERKKAGLDCTADECVQIKEYLKEFKSIDEGEIVSDIQSLFPIEYGQYLDEAENIIY